MKIKQKKNLLKLALQFVKLQLAGNILFWGTLGGTFVFKELWGWGTISALATGSLIAHILFFMVNKNWVFDEKRGRKTSREIVRFVVFMGLNYFINLGLTEYWTTVPHINVYLAQVLNGFIFTVWNFVGLKLWVFEPENLKHPALTYHSVKKGHRHAKTKQKATRAA